MSAVPAVEAGIPLVDAHAHLTDPAFAGEVEAVLARAYAAGVDTIVCAGYDAASSRAALALAERFPGVWATVGIHPNDVGRSSVEDFEVVAALARRSRVVGIGETGLDYYRDRTPPPRQREALEWHLHLAEELSLPVVVHNREADADVAHLLEASASCRHGRPPGMLHCLGSTDRAYLERMLAAGYYVSFAGVLTFKGNTGLREVAKRVPANRLLVETDAPYLSPEPLRGRRNEPAHVAWTAACLAELRDVPLAALSQQLSTNSRDLFPALAGLGMEAA